MKIFVLCSFILLIFTSCVSTHKSSTAQSIIPADFKNVYDESTFRENLYFISKNIGKDFDFILPTKQRWTGFDPSLQHDLTYWQNKRDTQKYASRESLKFTKKLESDTEIMSDNTEMFDLSDKESCNAIMELLLLQWAKELAVIQQGSVKIATTDYLDLSSRVTRDNVNKSEGFAYKLMISDLPGESIGADGADFSLRARLSGGMSDDALAFRTTGKLRLKSANPLDMIPNDQDTIIVNFAALVDRGKKLITYGYDVDVGSDLTGGGTFILNTTKSVKNGNEPELTIKKYVKIIDEEKHVDQSLNLNIRKISSEKYQYSFRSRSHEKKIGRKVVLTYIPDNKANVCNVEEVLEI